MKSTNPNEGEKLVADIKASRKFRASEAKSQVMYTCKSFCIFVEALALGITSGYAIYAGWYANLPTWGKDTLLIAGGFIAIRAFIEFVKFLNRR